MKIIYILVCGFTMLVHAKGFGQIDLSIKDEKMERVIKLLEKKSGYNFFYDARDIQHVRLSIDTKDASLSSILKTLLQDLPLRYEIIETQVFLSRKPEILRANQGVQDEKTWLIRGKVVDSLHVPLPHATIQVQGKKTNATTNAGGEFSIRVESLSDKLLVTHLGYQNQVVQADTGGLYIQLRLVSSELESVVLTGYAQINQQSFTGSFTQVTKEELVKIAPNNLIDILQVFDPSFRIQTNIDLGSDPNNLPNFFIRGQSGFPDVNELDILEATRSSEFALRSNPNLPIFILDGFEVGLERIVDFDVNRIKSATILKDAAATAMYGSRASNGVIILESISPRAGEFRVAYNGTFSITSPDLSSYNLMNAAEKIEAERLAGLFEPDVSPDAPSYEDNRLSKEWLYLTKLNQLARGVETDWLSKPVSNMFNQLHSVYVEGGSNHFRVGVEVKNQHQNGVMRASYRNRTGTGLQLGYHTSRLDIQNSVHFDRVTSAASPYGNFSDYVQLQPYISPYDEEGELLSNLSALSGRSQDNPLYEATLGNFDKTAYSEWTNSLQSNFRINNAITLKAQFAISYKTNEHRNFIDPKSNAISLQADPFIRGQLIEEYTDAFNWNTNVFSNFNLVRGVHHVHGSVGINAKSANQTYKNFVYSGFSGSQFTSPTFAQQMATKPIMNDNKTRLFGAFTMFNYTINNLFLFDASVRLDGSSEFGSERQWAPFWSFGTGLNLHQTAFMNTLLPQWDVLRIKVNVGETGKANFSPYMARNTFQVLLDDWYPTGIGGTLIYLGNPFLNWEKQRSWNYGLVARTRKGLGLELNYYRKTTYDLITDVSLPSSSGFPQYKDNVGEVLNEGWEIQFNAPLLRSTHFDLNVQANAAHNTNRITKIGEAMKRYNDRVDAHYANYRQTSDPLRDNENNKRLFAKPLLKFQEGNSLTAIYGMKSAGINPSNGKEVFLNRDGSITSTWSPYEQQNLGDTSPLAQGSLMFNMRYKRVSLYTSFLFEFGGYRYNQTLVNQVESVNLQYTNADRRVLMDRWQQVGDQTPLKSIQDRLFVSRPSSRFVQKNNALTFNSIQLNYDFPSSLTNRIGIKRAKTQVSMKDIGTISTIKQEMGLIYPFARTIHFGFNLTI